MRRQLALTAVVVAAAAVVGVGLVALLQQAPNPPAAATAGDAPSRVEGGSVPSATSADPRAGQGLGLDEVVRELDLIRPARSKRAEDFTVALLHGEPLKLREQRGKAVMINF